MRDVTPIRVRGKKKSRPPIVDLTTASHIGSSIPQKRHAESELSTTGLRHLTSSKGSKSSSGQSTPRRFVPCPSTFRKTLSWIERLPTEILEQIFLYALNISLPRSSPVISAKLSSEHTYRLFGRIIFGAFKDSHGNRYTTDGALADIDGGLLVKARNDALRCRWMTGTFFRTLRDDHLNLERARIGKVFSHHMEAYETYHRELDIDLGERCFIPTRLLRLPVSTDNRNLLKQLHQCGAMIDWVHTTTGEAARDAWELALIERDWDLINFLAELKVGHQDGDCPARAVVSLPNWDFDMLARIAELYPKSLRGKIPQNGNGPLIAVRRHELWVDPIVAAQVEERHDEESLQHSAVYSSPTACSADGLD